jgi:hypothetical protein
MIIKGSKSLVEAKHKCFLRDFLTMLIHDVRKTHVQDYDPRETKAWRLASKLELRLPLTCVTAIVTTLLLVRMGKLGRKASCAAYFVLVTILAGCGLVYFIMENMALLNSFMCRYFSLLWSSFFMVHVLWICLF